MPSLAAGLAAERRRKNAKHARRLEKKLGVKVAGSEERRLSGVFGHSVSVLSTGLSRTFSRRRSSDAFDMSRAEQLAQESRRRLTRRILIFVAVVLVVGGAGFVTVWQAFFVPPRRHRHRPEPARAHRALGGAAPPPWCGAKRAAGRW